MARSIAPAVGRIAPDFREDLRKQMSGLMRSAAAKTHGASASLFSAEINIAGRKLWTNDPREFAKLHRKFAADFGALISAMQGRAVGKPSRQSSFSGVINNNGVIQRFDSAEEFRQAQQQLQQE